MHSLDDIFYKKRQNKKRLCLVTDAWQSVGSVNSISRLLPVDLTQFKYVQCVHAKQ